MNSGKLNDVYPVLEEPAVPANNLPFDVVNIKNIETFRQKKPKIITEKKRGPLRRRLTDGSVGRHVNRRSSDIFLGGFTPMSPVSPITPSDRMKPSLSKKNMQHHRALSSHLNSFRSSGTGSQVALEQPESEIDELAPHI